ncbi:hypothetical protein NL108_011058 [Boleophthalmus pectinirostris]|uniref:T-cell surface glycoprotein CD3 gamma chain-like n=1 Tax=Boleophthalmus pectinirostris TaxID=150288 RepID=UPI00243039FA|nr:T-cell surface glycoprotein CD3 gamma chain-like [Boleophthalmus pectinirostris]KAJ0063825.1 hypothetical protein NL108_011058 [Boleophthalmus pectinirostris]
MNKLHRTCLWLFFLSVLIKCGAGNGMFKMKVQSGKVMCPNDYKLHLNDVLLDGLEIHDSNTGEYLCKKDGTDTKIFIKFRSCDNCVDLDVMSITGLIFGNVLATFVIGISVYLIAKHGQIGTTTMNKKASDKQPLVQPDTSDGVYQRLRKNDRDIYNELHK